MRKTVIRKYAELIASAGANIQKDQPVVIAAQADQYEFVSILAEECYKAGAGEVVVDWQYQPLTALDVRWQKQSVLGAVPSWEKARWRYRAGILPAAIYIESEDPDGLSGVDQSKLSRARRSKSRVIKPIRDKMEGRYQWCIAAVPGEKWAQKVFPGMPKKRAVESLWEAVLEASRANGDGTANWKAHDADLKARCSYLNSLDLRSLEYRASNGTDFRVGLIPGALFLGGSEKCLGSGVSFQPNIPSEECFTSPMAGQAEGIVFSSLPLCHRGVMIENFSVRFENGRVTEVRAEKNEEALKHLVGMDEGACMLGECALVPYDSPIRRSGIMFYNTLFDENAACHLALGAGFPSCIADYEKYTLEECRAMGVNDSIIHEDFMIGTADLAITGITADGRRIGIFRDGGWAFDVAVGG